MARFANSSKESYSECMKKEMFTITPKASVRRSQFDVTGLDKNVFRKEILVALRE